MQVLGPQVPQQPQGPVVGGRARAHPVGGPLQDHWGRKKGGGQAAPGPRPSPTQLLSIPDGLAQQLQPVQTHLRGAGGQRGRQKQHLAGPQAVVGGPQGVCVPEEQRPVHLSHLDPQQHLPHGHRTGQRVQQRHLQGAGLQLHVQGLPEALSRPGPTPSLQLQLRQVEQLLGEGGPGPEEAPGGLQEGVVEGPAQGGPGALGLPQQHRAVVAPLLQAEALQQRQVLLVLHQLRSQGILLCARRGSVGVDVVEQAAPGHRGRVGQVLVELPQRMHLYRLRPGEALQGRGGQEPPQTAYHGGGYAAGLGLEGDGALLVARQAGVALAGPLPCEQDAVRAVLRGQRIERVEEGQVGGLRGHGGRHQHALRVQPGHQTL
mmetsp:Transcript_5715/g.8552  ORF Transcript_5715/g.8552 Transcript_5715/m.8552 type:complete len:375 (+) Transcript_5715:498-1622(+)